MPTMTVSISAGVPSIICHHYNTVEQVNNTHNNTTLHTTITGNGFLEWDVEYMEISLHAICTDC